MASRGSHVRPMHVLPCVVVGLLLTAVSVSAQGSDALPVRTKEEALPAIFLTRAEKRAEAEQNAKPASPFDVPARTSALSPMMRASLTARFSALAVATNPTPTHAAGPAPSVAAASGADDPGVLRLEKYVVNMPRERRPTVQRDDPPLLRYLKTGKLYEKIYPDGRSLDVTLNVLPFVSRALNPQQSTRFEIALHYKW